MRNAREPTAQGAACRAEIRELCGSRALFYGAVRPEHHGGDVDRNRLLPLARRNALAPRLLPPLLFNAGFWRLARVLPAGGGLFHTYPQCIAQRRMRRPGHSGKAGQKRKKGKQSTHHGSLQIGRLARFVHCPGQFVLNLPDQ